MLTRAGFSGAGRQYVLPPHRIEIVFELIDRGVDVDGCNPSADLVERCQNVFEKREGARELGKLAQSYMKH